MARRFSSWSSLPLCELTTSGLIQMDREDGEVELRSGKNIELRLNASSIRLGGLTCTITTHRIVLVQPNQNEARFLHLSNISKVEEAGGNWLTGSKYKIVTTLASTGDEIILAMTSGSDRDALLKQLDKAYERKAWLDAARLEEERQQRKTTTRRRVGVDAIIRANEAKHVQASKVADKAFDDNDVESLMKEGAELVAIIQSYVKTLEVSQKQKQQKSPNDDNDDDTPQELANMLSHMGMTSALTKHQSTDEQDYYNKLARHVCDFIYPKVLHDAGGMMTLTDLYCLYNRARGTNMISPEDLLKAVDVMSQLQLPTSKREFASGLVVLQEATWSDEQMAQNLLELLSQPQYYPTGITSLDVSRALKVSPLLANEHLQASEQLGYLCRDVTLEGTRFYINRFCDDNNPFQI